MHNYTHLSTRSLHLQILHTHTHNIAYLQSILALLISVSEILALPGHVACLNTALVEGDQDVCAQVAGPADVGDMGDASAFMCALPPPPPPTRITRLI